MISTDLPDVELLERSQSIVQLHSTNKKAALTRTKSLLQYLDSRLSSTPCMYSELVPPSLHTWNYRT